MLTKKDHVLLYKHKRMKCLYLPVTSAFWSCPLIPVVQGLTIATLLVLQRYIPMVEITRKTTQPITPAKIGTWFFFDDMLLIGTSESSVDKGGGEL